MPASPSVRLHRTLHLIDADNLLGDPATCDRGRITAMFAEYRRVAVHLDGDHAVVATGVNGLHVLEVEAAWPGARYRRRPGVDGADLELLDEVEWVASGRRYNSVVIGSGDHIFVPAYQRLVAAGLTVDVVSRRKALSTALAVRAQGHVRLLCSIAPTPEYRGPRIDRPAA